MNEEKLIKKYVRRVKDKSGNTYSFDIKISKGYDYSEKKETLEVRVFYNRNPIVPLTFYKNIQKDEYESSEESKDYSGWCFELPEKILPRRKGIGSSLWYQIEKILRKYRVSTVRGAISGVPGMESIRNPEKYKIRLKKENEERKRFWQFVGFTVMPDWKMYKNITEEKGETYS